jgi:transglutaminase-like putative cysteine protease
VTGAKTFDREVPRRYGLSPWLLLTATDVVAIATLSRCFSGPGELALAIPACIAVHLLAGGGRRLATRRALRPGSHAGSARPIAVGALGWALALLVGFVLPLAIIDGHTFTFLLPLGSTWHVADRQLGTAWSIFSDKIAPVVEAPGLVLGTAWAAGAVALASEVLYADVGLPAVLALVPAFDVVVFTGTLGTSTGRAVELAGIAGLALAFLLTSQADRQGTRVVVMARTDVGPRDAGRTSASALKRRALPGVTVVAALAAGVVGPLLPGATSGPLIAWHGVAPRKLGTEPGGTGSGSPNKVEVSDLVQVAQQEIEDTDALLFTVHTTEPTRETLLTLDHFGGNAWSRIKERQPGESLAVLTFPLPGSIRRLERHPPAKTVLPGGAQEIDQVIEIGALGGSWLPSPGIAQGVDGDGTVSEVGQNGPLVAPAPLTANLTYEIKALLPASPPSPATGSPAPPSSSQSSGQASSPASSPASATDLAQDLQLPGKVPSDLVALAKDIVAGTRSPDAEALALQDYFLSGHGFTYHLPTVTPKGKIADTHDGYQALKAFLFQTKAGYCQQYASAFAVLARISGLPTRIAVGFLPGKKVGPDEYVVNGSDVHAWPEVYLAGYGWVSFEPTPGAPSPLGQQTPTPTITPGKNSPPPTTAPKILGHGMRGQPGELPGSAKGAGTHLHSHRANRAGRHAGSSGLGDILLGVLGLGIIWAAGVPLWRLLRGRRDRHDERLATLAAWRSATWVLAAASAHRRRSETHLEFATRVRNLGLLSEEANGALERLAHRMDRALYAPDRAQVSRRSDALAARSESAVIRRSARRRIAWWQQISLIVDPRDLLGPT